MLVEKLACSIKLELKFLIIYPNIGFNPDSVLMHCILDVRKYLIISSIQY